MALAQHRVVLVGETPHAHEREGIQHVVSELPNTDPYLAWGLTELLDASTGRLYEIDLLVLGHSALYLVEIKSGPGVYRGDSVDWTREVSGEPSRYMECPYRLANHKAKILASHLQRKLGKRAPRVQALIFLSHRDALVDLQPDGRTAVVTRATVKRALTHHDFPNSDPNWRGDPVSAPVVRDLVNALRESGVRARKGQLHVGAYELRDMIEEGAGYQDRLAVHRSMPNMRRRARTYLVPQQTSVERRQALRRAADREVQLLNDLREHAGVLSLKDYVEDAPLGPTVLFDLFEGGVRLDTFIRQNPKLEFSKRLEILEQIGHALAFCHRKEILHGGLQPESVLVRSNSDKVEARLFNFQLGSSGERVEGTAHISAWAAQSALVYQAPEVREDPTARTSQSDIFSLGALAYFTLTGQPPAADVAAVDERLRAQGCLDPRAADDRISADVAEVIGNATSLSWTQRFDDAAEWVELLLDSATTPEPASKPVFADPLMAGPGDRLSAELLVKGVLGQGASARVLRVLREKDESEYALKVSLSTEHDDRIRAEGQALARVRHSRIVEKIADLDLGGRACLLITLAGTTLQRQIQERGPVLLDYALRWGDDLLSAVEEIEDKGVPHRDIKPANLGIGSIGKRANHLTLFDFSLVSADATSLDIGTAAYRDRFLRSRGAWDVAADRWSAAVTLHEMLTGMRPTYGGHGGSAVDPAATLVLAAERFDPSIRDRLVRFFETALAREAEERFPSAEKMRLAWIACFHEQVARSDSQQASAPSEDAGASDRERATDEEIRKINPDTPLDALPLTARAKNALDRGGVARARDLLKLADNRLSAIRGVGRSVAQEIHDLRTRWGELNAASDLPTTPFFPNYSGENLNLAALSVPAEIVGALGGAGLRDLAAVAAAPDDLLDRLAKKYRFDVGIVRTALHHEHMAAEERDHPVTIEGWREALLPAKKKRKRPATPPVIRVLFGLDPATDGGHRLAIGTSASDASRAHGTSPANLYLSLGRCRETWRAHPAIGEVLAHAHAIVEESGGAVPLTEAADRLSVRLPHDRNRDPKDVRVDAAAILRIAAELDREAERDAEAYAGIVFIRIGEVAWLCASADHGATVRELARIADELAKRTPLASAPETQSAVLAVVAESPLASLPIERVVALAARASTSAACSTRFEMYPRGMPAIRAVELTASVLTGRLTPDDIRKRVADRYPEAEGVPERPMLDALVEPYGLRWKDPVYERPQDEVGTRHSTRWSTLTHLPTALPYERRAATPEAIEAGEIDQRLVHAVERKQLRLVLVRSDLAPRAIVRLSERLRVPARRVDRLLIDAMEQRAETDDVDLSVLHDAHQQGPTGSDWDHLRSLAEDSARDVATSLFPAKTPLLLTHFGLVARYALQPFFDALTKSSSDDDCEAIFLVIPAHDGGAQEALDGLTLPGLLPSQRLWVTRDWIENRHNTAAPAA